MPIGLNLLCLAAHVEEAHAPHLERLAALGYDGVEIPVLRGEPEHYRRLGARLDGLGLRRTVTAVIPGPEASPVSDDPEARARADEHLAWVAACAEALGAEAVGGPLHGPVGHFSGAGPTEAELDRAAEWHRRLADAVARGGAFVAMEPLNRFEAYLFNTAEQAAAHADQVDHPAFRVMHDTFHANIEERDQAAALRTLGPRLGVLHVSENDRGVVGRGQIDFEAVFGAAKDVGFDGWLVVEAFGAGLPELAAATRVWRPLFPDHETLFAESLAAVRDAWAAA